MSKNDEESNLEEISEVENSGEDGVEDKNKEREIKKESSDEEEEMEFGSEESELEEELKGNFEDFQSSQLSWPSMDEKPKAPVLERIAGEQEQPVFVRTTSQSSQSRFDNSENEENDFKYIQSSEEGNDIKYITTPEKVNTSKIERVDFTRAGRRSTNILTPNREISMAESYKPNVDSPMVERVFSPERIDTDKAGREDVFEKEDLKYDKYKPNLPEKGY